MKTLQRVFGKQTTAQTIGNVGDRGNAILVVDICQQIQQYPDAKFGIVVKRANNPPYPIEGLLSPQGNMLVWAVDPYVTAVAGHVDIEVIMQRGATVINSCEWVFFVTSLSSGGNANHNNGGSGCCCNPGMNGAPNWVRQLYDRADALDASLQEILNNLEQWQSLSPPEWATDIQAQLDEVKQRIEVLEQGGGNDDGVTLPELPSEIQNALDNIEAEIYDMGTRISEFEDRLLILEEFVSNGIAIDGGSA